MAGWAGHTHDGAPAARAGVEGRQMAEGKGAFTLDLAGQGVPSNGGAGQVLNPEGAALIVTKCVLYVETPSAGAANINAGIGAAGADNSNLINALAIDGAITGKAYNGLNPAANAEHLVWGAAEYLNATVSAASAAFVGKLYIEYLRV